MKIDKNQPQQTTKAPYSADRRFQNLFDYIKKQ